MAKKDRSFDLKSLQLKRIPPSELLVVKYSPRLLYSSKLYSYHLGSNKVAVESYHYKLLIFITIFKPPL